MYCSQCGSKLEEGEKVCPRCGEPIAPNKKTSTEQVSVGLCILSALIPLAGLIFFVVWRDDRPRQSKYSGICALVAFLVEVILGFVFGILLGVYWLNGKWIPDKTYPNRPGIVRPYPPSYWDDENSGSQQPSLPDHAPAEATYNDSADGVLKFTYYGNNYKTCYDNLTESIVVWNDRQVSVYNRPNGVKLFSYDYTMTVSAVSTYNGILCIGFGGNARQIAVTDINSRTTRTVLTEISVEKIAVTDGLAIFCDSDQWCKVGVIDLGNYSVSYLSNNFYVPQIAINHKDKILYIVETNSSSCDFIFVDLSTLKCTEMSKFGEYQYNFEGVSYDGEYVHAFGNTYNGTTGIMVADRGYAEAVNADNLLLTKTLFRDENLSIISEYDSRTIVYDNKNSEIIYTMSLAATELYHVGGDIYLASCGSSGYFGLIDLSKI